MMTHYQTNTYTLFDYQEVPIQATFYQGAVPYRATILYLHGGGLMFGQRDDLPTEYISLLTEAGYGLLTLDYLLAPESTLDIIHENIGRAVDWFLEKGMETLNVPTSDYYIMGRSAGGYLALYASIHASQAPRGVISLYGYFNLNEAAFNMPSRHFFDLSKSS